MGWAQIQMIEEMNEEMNDGMNLMQMNEDANERR